jgi:hypothetical protein
MYESTKACPSGSGKEKGTEQAVPFFKEYTAK